jgi:excisionase family DNA binding protein
MYVLDTLRSMDSGPTNLAGRLVLAYAAGVIDSDGYIGVKCAPSYSARVMVKQVTPQAIELLHELFGGWRSAMAPSAKRGRPLFTWEVHSAAAGRACEALMPYLRIKRPQAENAIQACRINAEPKRRRFVLPEIIEGEPMVTMAEAARRLGKDYQTVIQAVRHGSVPHVRSGPRKVLIPESYLPIWAQRRHTPGRHPDVTERLHACYLTAKALNRVGM